MNKAILTLLMIPAFLSFGNNCSKYLTEIFCLSAIALIGTGPS